MSDNKSKTGNPERKLINIEEDYEVRYWTEKFGVTAEQLKAAVKAAGPSAADVERNLNIRKG